MRQDVYILSAVRTAIGKFGGSLKDIKVSELGSIVICEVLKRAGLDLDDVDELIFGNCFPSGESGGNPARTAALTAGIPIEKPSFTVFENCTSSLRAVSLAASKIAEGESDIVLAGGVENMSQAPFISTKTRWGQRLGHTDLLDYLRVAMFDPISNYHMGETAENLAVKYKISRDEQDKWAFMSQNRAEKAIVSGVFDDEIIPINIETGKGSVLFKQDEHPKFGTTLESLSQLKPVFIKNGTVTAGNSSGLNDAAAALLLISEKKLKGLKSKPLAKILASAFVGVDPAIMGIAPVYATQNALKKAKLSLNNIDLIECNEAFAAQIIAVERELKWDRDKVNVNGGAISLGHPVGASGARILVTLCYELRRRKENFGLATMCAGGGIGGAIIVERA